MIDVQEDTDKSFIKKHQAVVKEQTAQWANSEAPITGALIDMNPYFPEAYGSEPSKTPEEKKKPSAKPSGKHGSGSSASHLSKSPSGGKSQASRAAAGGEAGDGSGKSNADNDESSVQGTMSAETRIALPGALKEIFAKHHVCRYYDWNIVLSVKNFSFFSPSKFAPNDSVRELLVHCQLLLVFARQLQFLFSLTNISKSAFSVT